MRVNRIQSASVLACGLLGSALVLACGAKNSALQPDTGDDTSGGNDAGGGSDSTSAPGDDGGPSGVFTSSDASGLPSGVVFDCKPGTYAGMFTTMVTNDAGGLFALFSLNWTGSLSITLQGKVTTSSAGEIPEPTLTIAPGAKLSGVDAYGGHFNADLTGQLDCPSKTLTATVADGLYSFLGAADGGGIGMAGSLSATYDGTMAAPVLTLGAMDLSSPQLMGTAAIGTWTATLQ
jgi:hypothetical protein